MEYRQLEDNYELRITNYDRQCKANFAIKRGQGVQTNYDLSQRRQTHRLE